MPIDISEKKAQNPKDAQVQRVLAKMQGNILQGHGRDCAVYLFLQFTTDTRRVRQVLAPYLSRVVTSAAKQYEDARKFKASKGDGELFASFFLSASGYRQLGFSKGQIADAIPERAGGAGLQSSFIQGMKAHGDELRDPASADWEDGYQQEIHALLLLAHDSPDELEQAELAARGTLSAIARVVTSEQGHAYRKGDQGYEHFGFADGISQPVFLQDGLASAPPSVPWDPLEPLSLVLVADGAARTDDAYGSFFVFRKLEQNVRGFVDREAALAKTLSVPIERVGAMVVGRFPDGTPLAVAEVPGKGAVNDFVFAPSSAPRCPLHAHLRKANPRGTLAQKIALTEQFAERPHRIVRRSIPYGDRAKPPYEAQSREDLPSSGVGTLFGCYQASIANQFAFIQSRWLNRPDFPVGEVGVDPIVGSEQAGSANDWGMTPSKHEVREDFGSFVTLKGGEFFFAPSLPFLAILAHT